MSFKIGFIIRLWIAMIILALINSLIGNSLVESWLGESKAQIYKIIIFIPIAVFISWLYTRKTKGFEWSNRAWIAGTIWFALTLAFEFFTKFFLLGNFWSKLLSDYNSWEVRLSVLALLSVLLSPLIVGGIINRKR